MIASLEHSRTSDDGLVNADAFIVVMDALVHALGNGASIAPTEVSEAVIAALPFLTARTRSARPASSPPPR